MNIIRSIPMRSVNNNQQTPNQNEQSQKEKNVSSLITVLPSAQNKRNKIKDEIISKYNKLKKGKLLKEIVHDTMIDKNIQTTLSIPQKTLKTLSSKILKFLSILRFENFNNYMNLITSIFGFKSKQLDYKDIFSICQNQFCLLGIKYDIVYNSESNPEPFSSYKDKGTQTISIHPNNMENWVPKTTDSFKLEGKKEETNGRPTFTAHKLQKSSKTQGYHFVYGIPNYLLKDRTISINAIYARDQQSGHGLLEIKNHNSEMVIIDQTSEGKWNNKYYSNADYIGKIITAYLLTKEH